MMVKLIIFKTNKIINNNLILISMTKNFKIMQHYKMKKIEVIYKIQNI